MNSGAVYTLVVINDPFTPGALMKVLIDINDATSAQLLGYGVLDNVRTPIVRLTYNNGLTEDVFDVDRYWSE